MRGRREGGGVTMASVMAQTRRTLRPKRHEREIGKMHKEEQGKLISLIKASRGNEPW